MKQERRKGGGRRWGWKVREEVMEEEGRKGDLVGRIGKKGQ